MKTRWVTVALPARHPGRGQGRNTQPNDYTSQNPSYASAAGGVISTANDLVAWMQALVGGKVLNAEYQRPVDRKERLSCPPEIVSRPIDALSPQPWKVVD
jgi:CubicO group peptidase (beta-lactamase class C family)